MSYNTFAIWSDSNQTHAIREWGEDVLNKISNDISDGDGDPIKLAEKYDEEGMREHSECLSFLYF